MDESASGDTTIQNIRSMRDENSNPAQKNSLENVLAEASKGPLTENDKNMPKIKAPPMELYKNYYPDYCKLFTTNISLINDMKQSIKEKYELLAKLDEIEKRSENVVKEQDTPKKEVPIKEVSTKEIAKKELPKKLVFKKEVSNRGTPIRETSNYRTPSSDHEKKFRIRRRATDIERHHKCPVENCEKSYGSDNSLIQHIKIKHIDLMDDPAVKNYLQKDEGSTGK